MSFVVVNEGEMRIAVEAFLLRMAEEVKFYAKVLAPVKTGALQQSIDILEATPTEVDIGTYVDYGLWQEIGFTHYQSHQWIPGKHYLQGGLDYAAAQFT